MQPKILSTLAVTAAFIPASLLVSVVLGLSGMSAVSDLGLIDLARAILAYALTSGLVVDGLRLVAGIVWQAKPKHRLRLGKILNEHLA